MKNVIFLLESEKKKTDGMQEACSQKEWSLPMAEKLKKYSDELAAAISILNGEIRESCGEFCTCGHYGIEKVKYCSKCKKEVRLQLQNSQERT